MKIIFCDSNAIFGLLLNICKWVKNNHSVIFSLAQNNEVYISSYVLEECRRNILNKFWYELTVEHVQLFLNSANHLLVTDSNAASPTLFEYVYDQDDAQILQDAIDVQADYLITQNIQDFQAREIFDQRWIRVTNRIPLSLLESL